SCVSASRRDPRSTGSRGSTRRGRGSCRWVATHPSRQPRARLPMVAAAGGRVVPLGVDSSFTPAPSATADGAASGLLGPIGAVEDLLHVGSTIDRKRIDILLRVFAAVRAVRPSVRLVRVGGPL